jgi:hypothetical protein
MKDNQFITRQQARRHNQMIQSRMGKKPGLVGQLNRRHK